ncbi:MULTISPECIES: hypothetical protein [unclassified Streptococcus]|uniref:hypothetical protein n=1 Tax=unclassified Streptococcus TaxID=2608887 RepID=UPI001431FCA3|nr:MULTISPECIES: hypothetical protein [unclassified Streptococcus]MBF0787251.1 hypothetical protein [Streptococcus sp. 19428wC2_LYSM12]MCQ9211937.1 hypothetical protein [Streptococcus sp. B01]MCQ9213265.1 hypothetical protein [Streptococcus sp. O1]
MTKIKLLETLPCFSALVFDLRKEQDYEKIMDGQVGKGTGQVSFPKAVPLLVQELS